VFIPSPLRGRARERVEAMNVATPLPNPLPSWERGNEMHIVSLMEKE